MLYICEGITGNAHHIERVIYRIKPSDHYSVCVIADNVDARDKYRVHARLSAVDRVYGRLVAVIYAVLVAVGRIHEILNVHIGRREQYDEAQQDYKDDLTCLALLFLFFAA